MVLVLQHLNDKQRAHCAAVCSDWRAAAALATRSVCLSDCSQGDTDSFCTWLHALEALAPLSSLELYPEPPVGRTTQMQNRNAHVHLWQLPWAQLQHLQVLKLGCFYVSAVPARQPSCWKPPARRRAAAPSRTSARSSQQPPVLQALACLELTGPAVGFLGSFAAPKLRSLACLDGGRQHQLKGDALSKAAAAFAKLLPQLQLLTSLEVSGTMCETGGLSHLSSLQHLQQLKSHPAKATTAQKTSSMTLMQSLPTSLTHLELDRCTSVMVTASSVISKLTALQVLRVHQAAGADLATLSCLVDLQHLVLTGTPLNQGSVQPMLGVFSCLTKLQHLELEAQGHAGMAQVPAADAAALTASSHLTALVLRPEFDLLPVDLPGGGLLGAGLQVLPDLVQLCTGVGLLAKPSAVQRLVHRCSSLQKLNLHPVPSANRNMNAPVAITTERLEASLPALWGLPGLQVLRLPPGMDVQFSPATWDALAGLTGLTELQVGYDVETAAEALQLTRLQPLQELHKLVVLGYETNTDWHFKIKVKFHDDALSYDDDFDDDDDDEVESQAAAGSPSDVWWRAVVRFISSACDDFSELACVAISADIDTTRGFLQQLQHEGKQLVQQLQS